MLVREDSFRILRNIILGNRIMKMWTARVTGISYITDDIAFGHIRSPSSSDSLEVGVRRLVTVLVIDDDRVPEVAAVSGKDDLSATGGKNRISFTCRNVDTQVLVFERILLADDADCWNHVRDAFHSDFFVSRKPVVDTFEIDAVLLGRDVRKAVALDNAVDFVGVVFQECLENVLDAVFHNPEGVESREEFFVVRVLFHQLGIMHAHFFIVRKGSVDFCDMKYEQSENNGDNGKSDVEKLELLTRNAELPCAFRIFRNDLDSVKLTTHNFTINGFP